MYKKGDIMRMKEADFQTRVLIPLFRKMGFKDVTAFGGGILERGKDIIMWKTGELEERINYGVVVKAKKITGNAETNVGAMNVLTQVRQMLKAGFMNPVTGERERIHYCYVACSKDITKEAMHSIEGELENNLDKIVRFIHPATNLFDLLDKHLPELSPFERLAEVQQDLDRSMENTPYRLVVDSPNSISIVGKDPRAHEILPFIVKTEFEVDESTPDGIELRKRFEEHFERGTRLEIGTKFIKSIEFPDFLPESMRPMLTPDSTLVLESRPSLEAIPVRIDAKMESGETESIENIELRVQRVGNSEIVLSNEGQNFPWTIDLTINSKEKRSNFNYRHNLVGATTFQQLKTLRMMHILENDGVMQITNLKTGFAVPWTAVGSVVERQVSKELLKIVQSLYEIERTLLIDMSNWSGLTNREIGRLQRLAKVLKEGKHEVTFKDFLCLYDEEEARDLLANLESEQIVPVIYKPEEPESIEILGHKVDLGKIVIYAEVYLDDARRSAALDSLAAGDIPVEVHFFVSEETAICHYLRWIDETDLEKIKSLSIPKIAENEIAGTWIVKP